MELPTTCSLHGYAYTPTNKAVRLNGKALEDVSVPENTGYTTKQEMSTRTKENTSPLIISYKGYGFIAIPDTG